MSIPFITQEALSAGITADFKHRVAYGGGLWARMGFEYLSCSAQEHSVTMQFPVLEWELDLWGNLHPGVIATAADSLMGFLARGSVPGSRSATSNLTLSFFSPVPRGEMLLAKATLYDFSPPIVYLTAAITLKDSGRPVANANAIFFLFQKQ